MEQSEQEPHRLLKPWVLQTVGRGAATAALATVVGAVATRGSWRLAPARTAAAFVGVGVVGLESPSPRQTNRGVWTKGLQTTADVVACAMGATLVMAYAAPALCAVPPALLGWAAYGVLLYAQYTMARFEQRFSERPSDWATLRHGEPRDWQWRKQAFLSGAHVIESGIGLAMLFGIGTQPAWLSVPSKLVFRVGGIALGLLGVRLGINSLKTAQ